MSLFPASTFQIVHWPIELLNHTAKDVDKNLEEVEEKKLKELGKTRSDYETLADDLEKSVSEIK